ncbi:ATP-NAD kinase-like domain-containing protein [Gymnopilus junonius]|uniref:ATP-NAD kinase-like domain-containing protein n=1 Tax=Gymnopilus junonius TaxID=109634 RepID=A0A9P5NR58_GYMJU|nr:ATP-NAD kinase-like domain-containing protein [Gymnopilus junonius]
MADKTISIHTDTSSTMTLSLTDLHLKIQKPTKTNPTTHHNVPHRNILKASLDDGSHTLTIAYLDKKKQKPMHMVVVEGTVEELDVAGAAEWVEAVMIAAYENLGVKRCRRLMVLVNPFGGQKKGAAIFARKVKPVFEMAGCSLEIICPYNPPRTCSEVARTLPIDQYDAVVTVSGDGLIHEVLNGFAEHPESIKALKIPIAPVPTGSGNALSLNLLGIEDGFDVVVAALNAIKGKAMKRTISFMSQAVGLIAEVDLGTENLRWMGDTRFTYGLLWEILKFKPCPVELSFKLAENDKDKMAATVHLNRTHGASSSAEVEEHVYETLPPLKHLESDGDEWTTLDDSVLYVYAGQGPFVNRDWMAFPVSSPNDGLVDIAAMSRSSRGDLLSLMDGATKGTSFWHPKVHYIKAHAYRIKPLKDRGYFAVDGESLPFKEFQVEVHKGLGTFLSPFGYYAAKFEPRTVPVDPRKETSKLDSDS